MNDFENVEDLIQRCTFNDFGMGVEPWEFAKACLRQRGYLVNLEQVKHYLSQYQYQPILVELGGSTDRVTYLVNGVEVATWHTPTNSSTLPNHENVMVIGEFPHRDHPEERTKVYCCDVYDLRRPFTFAKASELIVRRLIEHETLENFYVDGVRVFDPHAHEAKPKAVIL